MAELFKFQELGGRYSSTNVSPKVVALSSNALTLIVSDNLNNIQVFQRHGPADPFIFSGNEYSKHKEFGEVTALSLQDVGVHAVSGDCQGGIHIWQTDSPNFNVAKKFEYGRVVSVAVSRQYVLASFYDEKSQSGVMQLIKKGYNLDDQWVSVKKFEGGFFSRCAISEHGKPIVPHIMYYTERKIVYEENPRPGTNSTVSYQQQTPPWCMQRNTATADLLVFGIVSQRRLLLWAPQVPCNDENPMIFKLSSKDSLRLNQSLVMSSVVSSAMFLASVYDGNVNIIRARRTRDIEREKQTENEITGKRVPDQKKPTTGQEEQEGNKTVLQILSEHVKDPTKPLELENIEDVKTEKTESEMGGKLSQDNVELNSPGPLSVVDSHSTGNAVFTNSNAGNFSNETDENGIIVTQGGEDNCRNKQLSSRNSLEISQVEKEVAEGREVGSEGISENVNDINIYKGAIGDSRSNNDVEDTVCHDGNSRDFEGADLVEEVEKTIADDALLLDEERKELNPEEIMRQDRFWSLF